MGGVVGGRLIVQTIEHMNKKEIDFHPFIVYTFIKTK